MLPETHLRDALHRLLIAFRLELRLIVRHWAHWLLMVAYSGLFIANFAQYTQPTAQEHLFGGMGRNAIGISSLIGLFMRASGHPVRAAVASIWRFQSA